MIASETGCCLLPSLLFSRPCVRARWGWTRVEVQRCSSDEQFDGKVDLGAIFVDPLSLRYHGPGDSAVPGHITCSCRQSDLALSINVLGWEIPTRSRIRQSDREDTETPNKHQGSSSS